MCPAEYNGYKVYWEDGAQITPPHDTGIMSEVKAVADYSACKTMDKEKAIADGLYIQIGANVDDPYIAELKKQVKNQKCIDEMQKDIKIVYTPLHGTGNIPVRRVLKELGFENVYVVKEQELPDGNFPTVSYPNPEADECFALAKKIGDEVGADLLLATDPDADRLGVYVKGDKPGEYHVLTGNMSGCLLAEYELSQMKENGTLPEDGALIKTIVTTNLANGIAKYYGVNLIEVLTGFKYIGEQILKFETTGKGHYCFGFEESYGCLIGTHARDKDAVVASMALCEAAAYYKKQGLTLWDQMLNIYKKYGYYKELTVSVTKEGVSGADEIKQIMENIRQNPITQLGKYKVLKFRDYKQGTIKDLETGKVENTNLPTSNVLYFELNNDAWCCVRPSGTEPKIKFYIGIKENNMEDAEKSLKELAEKVKILGQ